MTRRLVFATAALLSLMAVFATVKFRIFDTFDKDHLIRSAFNTDLSPYLAAEKTTYSDGCLQFHGITDTHPLFLSYFSEPHQMTFHISFLHEEFTDPNARDKLRIRRIGKSFDGYSPVVAYDPRLKRMVFGYSDGSGG